MAIEKVRKYFEKYGIEDRILELAKKYNMTEDEVKKQYDNNLEYIAYDLKVRKAFDVIKGE